MSGSSNWTFRMPRSFQPASTLSTETDLSAAITMTSAPGSVVPNSDLEADIGGERLDRFPARLWNHGQPPALPAVTPQPPFRQDTRWLPVPASQTQALIRVVHDD